MLLEGHAAFDYNKNWQKLNWYINTWKILKDFSKKKLSIYMHHLILYMCEWVCECSFLLLLSYFPWRKLISHFTYCLIHLYILFNKICISMTGSSFTTQICLNQSWQTPVHSGEVNRNPPNSDQWPLWRDVRVVPTHPPTVVIQGQILAWRLAFWKLSWSLERAGSHGWPVPPCLPPGPRQPHMGWNRRGDTVVFEPVSADTTMFLTTVGDTITHPNLVAHTCVCVLAMCLFVCSCNYD